MTIEDAIENGYNPIVDASERMDKLDVSVAEVAELSGVNQATIYRWFGREPETITKLRKILAALDVMESQRAEA